MECLSEKTKGFDHTTECQQDFEENEQSVILWSNLSLGDYPRRKKKRKKMAVSDVNKAATAPVHGASSSRVPGRGLKRKIGCIDVATRFGRKGKIDNEYELVKTIGKGKFGLVMLCLSRATGEEFACKTLQKGEEVAHREVEIMQHLSGYPSVVTLKAVYQDAESFHLVMELCHGGRLVDKMAREGMLSERKAASIVKELMLAIRYCHEMGVVHRDIKPENILLTSSGRLKLADFGLATRIGDGQRLTGVVGTPAYLAPEVLDGSYSEKADIWSAGVLLHALLVGFLPFQGNSRETVFEAIKKEKLNFDGGIWNSVSQPARDLLSGMLTRSVSQRLSASEVLKNPWISFYTEPMFKTHFPEPKPNSIRLSPRLQTHKHGRNKTERKRSIFYRALNIDSITESTSSSSSDATGGDDDVDSSVVDILTNAISGLVISEPKRSRTCSSPSRAMQQDFSFNLKTNKSVYSFLTFSHFVERNASG